VCLQMSIAANQAAEIPATIIRVLKCPLGESPRSHEFVEPCEMRPACSALLRAGHVLPTPLREKAVIPAGHERGAILQRYSECGLDGAPVREHPGFYESPIVTDAPGAVDLVPDLQLVQRPRAAISHEDSCVSSYTVTTTMTASSIRIDRLLEGNIGRIVVADDRARTLGLERRGDAVGFVFEVPAIVDRLELLQIEAPGRIRERSPAGE